MSANGFVVYYGLRWDVPSADREQLDLLEARRDPRQLAARQHKLKVWFGRADEHTFFVLFGAQVGNFGRENLAQLHLSDDEAARIVSETRERLTAAGFTDEPSWHFQFEPDQ